MMTDSSCSVSMESESDFEEDLFRLYQLDRVLTILSSPILEEMETLLRNEVPISNYFSSNTFDDLRTIALHNGELERNPNSQPCEKLL